MTDANNIEPEDRDAGRRHALWLLAIAALYVILRLPWVGHLLHWDEAMNLCAVRSFAARGQDVYLRWFWHHPPLMNLLLLLIRPLTPGFAERAHLLFIGIGLLNVGALFVLCRRTLGSAAALWAAFFYAAMPGAIFYDLWIKQDPLVSLFGMLSIYAFIRTRPATSGLLMGLAFLAKEMAAVYAIALCVVWLLGSERKKKFPDLVVAGVVTILASGWWFVVFSTSVKYYIAVMTGLPVSQTDAWVWARPWSYYFAKLPVDLGLVGVLACLSGLTAAMRGLRHPRRSEGFLFLWPAGVLVPLLFLISVPKMKAAWFLSSFYPIFAALEGLGMLGLLQTVGRVASSFGSARREGRAWGAKMVAPALAVAVVIYSVTAVWGREYEQVFRQQDWGLWWGAAASRDAAASLNRVAAPGERILVTPMFYWEGRDRDPCPIFVYYMNDFQVVVRPFHLSFTELVTAVREYDIDWAMLSPQPETAAGRIIVPLQSEYGINPLLQRGTMLIRTEAIRGP